jgi:transposase-like protein
MTEPTSAQDLFRGRHFDQEIIILCIRWYLTFKLSSRDLVQMMAERGIALAHTTILRWVQRYVPDFEKRWNQYARPVGDSWRVDETYIKVKGQWGYLYRIRLTNHTADRGWDLPRLISAGGPRSGRELGDSMHWHISQSR